MRGFRAVQRFFRDRQLLSTLNYLLKDLVSRAAASQNEANTRKQRHSTIKTHPSYNANAIEQFTRVYKLTKAVQIQEIAALKTEIKNTKAQIASLTLVVRANANVVPADHIHKLTEAEDQFVHATAELAMVTDRLNCLRALAVKRASNAAQVEPVAPTGMSREANTPDAQVKNAELLRTHNRWTAAQVEVSHHSCNLLLMRHVIAQNHFAFLNNM